MTKPSRHLIIIATAALAGFFTFFSAVSGAVAENSTDISSRIAREQQELENARRELAAIDQKIFEQQKGLEQKRAELADANSKLRIAEERFHESLKRFEDRISAIYKLGESRFYAVMLDSEDFSDALTRLSYLGTLSENDKRMVDRVKAEEQEVRALHDRVDSLKQEQAEDVNALIEKKNELVTVISTGKNRIDSDMAKLAKVQEQERQEEALRMAQEAYYESNEFTIFGIASGPSVIVGGSRPPAGMQPSGVFLNGQASWYGPGFHGNTTANGEIYNMYALTAAHKTLPFGTWLKITYTGRSVFVRINDRGPYIAGRFLDLSAGAAQAVGLTGVGYVTAEFYR